MKEVRTLEPISVGLLNDSFPPQIDGVANAVMNYAEVITRKYGNAVVAAPYYPDYSDDIYPYRVVRYSSMDTTNWVGYRAGYPLDPKAIDAMSKEPLNILHAHCPVTAVMLGRALRETMNIPMVFTYHTKFDIDIKNAISAKLLQEAAIHALVHNIEACDDVWVVSRGAGKTCVRSASKASTRSWRTASMCQKGARRTRRLRRCAANTDSIRRSRRFCLSAE